MGGGTIFGALFINFWTISFLNQLDRFCQLPREKRNGRADQQNTRKLAI
jgi:hypothetical protein